MTTVWIKKQVIIAATKSTRIKSWANQFKCWIPGSLQRVERHRTSYNVQFKPHPRHGRIELKIPANAMFVDVEQARKVFRAGPSIEAYDTVWDLIRGARPVER